MTSRQICISRKYSKPASTASGGDLPVSSPEQPSHRNPRSKAPTHKSCRTRQTPTALQLCLSACLLAPKRNPPPRFGCKTSWKMVPLLCWDLGTSCLRRRFGGFANDRPTLVMARAPCTLFPVSSRLFQCRLTLNFDSSIPKAHHLKMLLPGQPDLVLHANWIAANRYRFDLEQFHAFGTRICTLDAHFKSSNAANRPARSRAIVSADCRSINMNGMRTIGISTSWVSKP